MSKKNFKKIIVGSILVIFGVGLFAAAIFYYLEVKPELAKRKQVQLKKLKAKEVKVQKRILENQQGAKDTSNSKENKIPLQVSKEERNRKEGVLWVNQATQYIVTLGAVNNVSLGDYLTVFDGDKKIGQVKVIELFDTISYVQPLEKKKKAMKKKYYRVIVE